MSIFNTIVKFFKADYNLGKSTPPEPFPVNRPKTESEKAVQHITDSLEYSMFGIDKQIRQATSPKLPKLPPPPNKLTDREKFVLALLIGGNNISQVAEKMGVTRERIRQIYAKIGRKIQK